MRTALSRAVLFVSVMVYFLRVVSGSALNDLTHSREERKGRKESQQDIYCVKPRIIVKI